MATERVSRPCRIGCGAGFSGDRIDEARDLALHGKLDFLFFEGLAERTLAQSQLQRQADPAGGFNPRLGKRLEAVLAPCRAHGTRIVTNMGAANPLGAAELAAGVARHMGLHGLRIAVITGDDVAHRIDPAMLCMERGESLGPRVEHLIGAHAYLGAEAIARALDDGADLVITGRVADPALVLGPLMHHFGWRADAWDLMAAGTLVGHLLECGFQITGGYFADPGVKDVPGLDTLGYPIAEVDADGSAVISKLQGSGGMITRETVLEQLLYEVHDPAAYITPDVIANFSGVVLTPMAPDRIGVRGARGRPRPDTLKVTVGFDGGYLAEAEMSYAGPGALARARLAGQVVTARMRRRDGCPEALRIDLIGASSLFATAGIVLEDSQDIRLRAALRTDRPDIADALLHEVESLWIAGPAGGAGYRGRITPSVETRSILLDRATVTPTCQIVTA